MKLRANLTGIVALLSTTTVLLTAAADVEYAVVAFPSANQGVAVSIGGKTYPLQQNKDIPNLFAGSAPEGQTYQYALTEGEKHILEAHQRTLAKGAIKTGNEFFNRSRTVYDVPELPQAYHPIYPRKRPSSFTSLQLIAMIL